MVMNMTTKKAKGKVDQSKAESPYRRLLTKVINVVTRGSEVGGFRAYDKKKYARSSLDNNEQYNEPKRQKHQITYNDDDLKGVMAPYDDDLVFTLNIEGI